MTQSDHSLKDHDEAVRLCGNLISEEGMSVARILCDPSS